jgi:hypothetical protein
MSQPKDTPPMTTNLAPLPDFLGTVGRVKTLADLLQQGQSQLVSLEAQMIVNGQSRDEPIDVTGKNPTTYGERIAALKQGMQELFAANEDVREELIAAAVKARRDMEMAG